MRSIKVIKRGKIRAWYSRIVITDPFLEDHGSLECKASYKYLNSGQE